MAKNTYTIMILFSNRQVKQTMLIQIKLLLKESSMVKLNFRIITAFFSGVLIFVLFVYNKLIQPSGLFYLEKEDESTYHLRDV